MLDTARAASVSRSVHAIGNRLAGKTAVITGGAGGMGQAASLLFAREGAKVAIIDIARAAGNDTVAAIRDAGGEAIFVETDVSRAMSIAAAFDQVDQSYGPLDVLFNHAGTIIVKPFDTTSELEYDRLMDINVRSAFFSCQQAIRRMLAKGGGSIVITSSIGGEKGFALESLYCMTKGAVLQLARSIATEYRDRGIRANCVMPGFVKTAHGLREIDELDALGQVWEDSALAGAQGRICEPEEVARAALFLASDEASFVNGTALYVDNGWFAKG
jgi:NAD(P)-dependent dehydrogenase (short-subunit alcohol dehydrogenase family)